MSAPTDAKARGSDRLFASDFAALLLVQMAFGFAQASFLLLPKFMAQNLSAGASAIGAVGAAFGLAGLAAIPLVGRLLARSGRSPRVILSGALLMSAASLGFVAVDRADELPIALRFLQGVASALVINAGTVLATDLAPAGRVAEAIGFFAGANMLMNAVAPVIAEALAEQHGYVPVFALASAAAALAGVLGLRVRPRTRVDTNLPAAGMIALLSRTYSLRMGAILVATGIGFGVMFTFSAPLALGVGVRNLRGFFAAFAGMAVIVRLFLGRAIDQIGPRRVASMSLFAYGIVVASMYALTPERLEPLGALFGVVHGLFLPAFTALVVQGAPSQDRGGILTLFHGFMGAGNALVMLLGVFAERVGYPLVFALTGGVITLAPLLLVHWPAHAAFGAEPEAPRMQLS